MPITLTPFTSDSDWEGCTWSVANVDELAAWIAWVAVGQSYHVANILHAVGAGPLPTNDDAIKDAVKLLTAGVTSQDHRDGWMFQVMSWLAAHRRTPNALIAAPHMIHAEKGLDGLELILDSDKSVIATVIFEDKATVNPRDTIRDAVWPEFVSFEGGTGVNRMSQQATGILMAAQHPRAMEAVSKIVWKSTRRYRVSITAPVSTVKSRKSLFKGYATKVPGAIERRRAEVFAIHDLRPWMAALAAKAIDQAMKMKTN